MLKCPRQQSHRWANNKTLLPDSHPAQRTWKTKLPLLRAGAGRLQTQAQSLPGLEIHGSSQRDANWRSQGKGESVPIYNDKLSATVPEGLGSLQFPFTKNIWHRVVMMMWPTQANLELISLLPFSKARRATITSRHMSSKSETWGRISTPLKTGQ